MRRTVLGFLAAATAFGQSATFEAASIKPAPPPDMHMMRVGMSGGPGTPDPGFFKCDNCSLQGLITSAFNIKRFQLTGPAWLESERFDVNARIPAGATKEQFREMQQNLLIQRFGMTFHREQKEMPVYEMVVAKGGLKLKESESSPDGPPPPAGGYGQQGKMVMDKDGFPVMQSGGRPMMIMMNGRARNQASAQTMEEIAAMLSNQLGKPVKDATGLKGKYDYKLSWAPDNIVMGRGGPMMGGPDGPAPVSSPDAEPLPVLLNAVQEQLGLKLESRRGMAEVTVIDHIEKTPSDN